MNPQIHAAGRLIMNLCDGRLGATKLGHPGCAHNMGAAEMQRLTSEYFQTILNNIGLCVCHVVEIAEKNHSKSTMHP
jgi:hypothetical protein